MLEQNARQSSVKEKERKSAGQKRRRPRAVHMNALTTSEAAKYIGVSKKTLLKYCRQRQITFMRYPGGEFRFRQVALDLFMSRCTVEERKAA